MSSQESRKDPRSKVLNLTVRYKSATVAEFVEDYSYDISRGGLFIKTSNPFPVGTLLKFEVRIGEEQTVIDGVGRVTWRRERSLDTSKPAGMGIKFIRIADESVQLIQNAVEQHAGQGGQFEEGAREQGVFLSEPPANLRGDGGPESNAPAVVPRMFPASGATQLDDPSDHSMLFQSTELLKSAMSKVAPAASEHATPNLDDRATLPTGSSELPAATEKKESQASAPLQAQGAAKEPTVSPASTAAEPSRPTPPDDAPDSSDEVTRQFVPGSDHPLTTHAAKGRSGAKRKNPKKKKKKFNYTSLPAAKQSKPPTSSPPDADRNAVTSPPQPLSNPQAGSGAVAPTSSRGWLVALGVVVVGFGLFLVLRARDRDTDGAPPVVAAEPSLRPSAVQSSNDGLTPTSTVGNEVSQAPSTAPSAAASTTTTASAAASGAESAPAPEVGSEVGSEEAAKEAAEEATASRKPRRSSRRKAAKKPANDESPADEALAPSAPPSTGSAKPAPAGAEPGAAAPADNATPSPSPQPPPSPQLSPQPESTPQAAPQPPPIPAPQPPSPPNPVPPAPAPPAPAPPAPAPPGPLPPSPAQ